MEKVRGIAGVEEETEFEEEACFRGGAGLGEVIKISGQESEDFGMAMTAAEGLDQFAAVGGEGEALQISAQADAQIDEFSFAQVEEFSPLGRAVVEADLSEGFEGRAEAIAAGAGAAGEALADSVIRGEKSDDAVTLAVVVVVEDDGVAGGGFHAQQSSPCRVLRRFISASMALRTSHFFRDHRGARRRSRGPSPVRRWMTVSGWRRSRTSQARAT
jgi:hypothetical protein